MRARERPVFYPLDPLRVCQANCLLVRAWALHGESPLANSTLYTLAATPPVQTPVKNKRWRYKKKRQKLADNKSDGM